MGDWVIETQLAQVVRLAQIKFDAAMENPNVFAEIARAADDYKLALSRLSTFLNRRGVPASNLEK